MSLKKLILPAVTLSAMKLGAGGLSGGVLSNLTYNFYTQYDIGNNFNWATYICTLNFHLEIRQVSHRI